MIFTLVTTVFLCVYQRFAYVTLTMIYCYLYQRLFEILYNDFQTMIFSPVNNGFMDSVPTIYKADFKQWFLHL